MRKRLELTTKGGKCGCSSSILSFRNYNHEKRCTKGGEVLSCISSHLSARRPPTLLPAARKGLRLRFGEQKVHTRRRRKTLNRRRAGRRLCSPPPAKAYGLVSGSKIFTQGGGGKRLIAGSPAAAFAPRRPQRLTASFRGAKSSQKAAAENALSPARRPAPLFLAARKGLRLRSGEQNLHRGRRRKTFNRRPRTLLSAAHKGLRLRSGEQKVHTRRRRKTPYRRLADRRLCSPPPAKAYGFVSGSKIFTEGGGGNPIPSVPVSAAAVKIKKGIDII